MTQILGRIVTPNRPAAPGSPATGEAYFDTAASVLYWWNGTTWMAAGPGLPAGGTTGQVLRKTSNGDFAVAWQNVPADTVWPGSP